MKDLAPANDSSNKRFRFVPFNEAIKQVRMRVPLALEDSDTCPSQFVAGLQEWELDLDFPKIQSLAQVLHHKDRIVGVLEACLLGIASGEKTVDDKAVGVTSSSLEAILDLVSRLSQDLRQELPSTSLVRGCVSLVKTHVPAHVLQQIFTALAHVLKYVRIDHSLLLPLLSNSKNHIRVFAADAIAYILRRLKSPLDVYEELVTSLSPENPILSHGLSLLFFQVLQVFQILHKQE